MITCIDGIPVYRALLDDERDGIVRISLVDDPAVMSDFQKFDRQDRPMRFAVQDEERRIVRGVVMRADFPIYRIDPSGGEYFIMYPASTIREMAEKYLLQNRQNNVDEMHDGQDREDINMVQWFIKDTAAGVSPAGFEDISDGSLFAEFHVLNDDAWAAIKDGTYKGFSLEGFFSLTPEQETEKVEEIVDDLDGMFERIISKLIHNNMTRKERLFRKLGRILASFGAVTTDRGILVWDGDEDLKAGDPVFIEDEDGNRAAAADGDYKTEDGKTIVVENGAVVEIRDPEAEVAPDTAEPAEEVELGSIDTDNGPLYWEGDGELAEGTPVFIQDEAGENIPAPDGEYRADGRIITVADGVVASIAEDQVSEEPAADEPVELRRHKAVRAAFEESYDDRINAIAAALADIGLEYPYIVEAGDTFAVVCVYGEDGEKYYRYELTFDEAGNCILGDFEEVVPDFIPAEEEAPSAEEEIEAMRRENAAMRAEIARLSRLPLAKPAHASLAERSSKTGDKGLDTLARYTSARRK